MMSTEYLVAVKFPNTDGTWSKIYEYLSDVPIAPMIWVVISKGKGFTLAKVKSSRTAENKDPTIKYKKIIKQVDLE